jgi:predicted TPR repeat methyltransferase
MSFRLPPAYTPNPEPTYFVDDTSAVWQPDLYAEVASDARCGGTILDLGCGAGDKLVALDDRFALVGVDCGENIQTAVRQTRGRWLALDLEAAFPEIESPSETTIIAADVVEHLRDPRLILWGLSKAHFDGSPLIVISTPDRDKLHGPDHLGPPANPCHAREWAPHEFRRLLADYGLRSEPTRWTRSSSASERRDTMVFTVAQ